MSEMGALVCFVHNVISISSTTNFLSINESKCWPVNEANISFIIELVSKSALFLQGADGMNQARVPGLNSLDMTVAIFSVRSFQQKWFYCFLQQRSPSNSSRDVFKNGYNAGCIGRTIETNLSNAIFTGIPNSLNDNRHVRDFEKECCASFFKRGLLQKPFLPFRILLSIPLEPMRSAYR